MRRLFTLIVVLATISTAIAKRHNTLCYGTAESVAMDGKYLSHTIASIANASIEAGCFPGCQILVARRGTIVHHKSYGYHTNEKLRAVENSHIYDMASCTKVMAATICLMRLVEQKKLDLDTPIANYLEEFKGTSNEKLTLREILTHQSGLRNEGFSRWALDKEKNLNSTIFSSTQSEEYPHAFCEGIYVQKKTRQMMLNRIANQKPRDKKFHYSCYNFHLAGFLVERITGVKDAMYNPTRKYSLEQIVPTELDNRYRKKLVHGYVHDEAAAFMGGVSGNAGLFANTESLAPILQMLLNGGEYNGVRYFKHRAIGFDRRRIGDKVKLADRTTKPYYYAPSTSEKSFGHSGFTGTMVWADPKSDLIFIFLSNRVHPTRRNKVYFEVNPRSKCHEAAYQAIRRYKK